MLTIENIEKIVSINSQAIEVGEFDERPDYYEFAFIHDNIDSTSFKVHMNRRPSRNDKESYTMQLWDSISSTPLEYAFGLKEVNNPFALLKYLNDVVFDWNVVTNK